MYRIGSRVVDPSWCGIGGHFEKFELNDAKACMIRELEEEISLKETDISSPKLRYLTLRLKNNEIRQNYYFFADLNDGVDITLQSDEGRLEWFPINRILDLAMPFTAKHLLTHYLRTGKYTDFLYSGTAVESGVIFTELKEF